MTNRPALELRIIEQLLLARFELEGGRTELAARSDRGAIKAIKSFHDALESFLVAVADHVGIPRTFRNFHEYPKAIEKGTQVPFKHVAVINEVNALRTPAKHSALYPHPSAVQAVAGRLNAVFEDNSFQYLGQSFFGLRLAGSIRHLKAREEVAAAEEAFEKGDFGAALGSLRVGFDVAIGEYIGSTGRALFSRRIMEAAGQVNPWFRHDLNEANSAWDRVTRRLDLVENGINLADHRRFLAVTPNVFIPIDHRHIKIYQRSDQPLVATHENAAFALTFVIQTLNDIESRTKPPSSRSYYQIRAKIQTRSVELADGGSLVEVQTFAPGQEVSDARFGLGPKGFAGHVWIWESGGKRHLAAFDAFDIVKETSERDYHMREARVKPTFG